MAKVNGRELVKTSAFFLIIIIFILLSTLSTVQAATIQGKIYLPDLELAKKSLVNINSAPRQNLVSSDGTYSFIVPQGTYTIEAFYTIQGILLYANETITVPQEGSFNLDIILFETPDIEDIDLDETDLKLIEDLLKEKPKTNWDLIIGMIAIVIVIAVAIYLFLKAKKEMKKTKPVRKHKKFRAKTVKANLEEEKPVGDEAIEKTLTILKREKRVTQKDIRKELKISEAKASLIIADLEAQGKVKKIKRGRGNIILYQE